MVLHLQHEDCVDCQKVIAPYLTTYFYLIPPLRTTNKSKMGWTSKFVKILGGAKILTWLPYRSLWGISWLFSKILWPDDIDSIVFKDKNHNWCFALKEKKMNEYGNHLATVPKFFFPPTRLEWMEATFDPSQVFSRYWRLVSLAQWQSRCLNQLEIVGSMPSTDLVDL